MEFSNEEIQLLVDVLKKEKNHATKKGVYVTLNRRKLIDSAYQKLLQVIAGIANQYREENGHHCNRCQCQTPESELDNNGGICNVCVQSEINGK